MATALSWSEAEESSVKVSEIVDGGVAERSKMSDSIAATGGVMSGSLESRLS